MFLVDVAAKEFLNLLSRLEELSLANTRANLQKPVQSPGRLNAFGVEDHFCLPVFDPLTGFAPAPKLGDNGRRLVLSKIDHFLAEKRFELPEIMLEAEQLVMFLLINQHALLLII